MSVETTVEEYYDALRSGESLTSYFAETDGVVKVGISERLVGYEEVVEGLREQTETTTDWTVESHGLSVTERESTAWFADEVRMAWTDRETGEQHAFDTRWTGTLEQRVERWRFVGMHVSVAQEL